MPYYTQEELANMGDPIAEIQARTKSVMEAKTPKETFPHINILCEKDIPFLIDCVTKRQIRIEELEEEIRTLKML